MFTFSKRIKFIRFKKQKIETRQSDILTLISKCEDTKQPFYF